MSLQHFGKGALRVAKNYTKGYSDVQSKVRDATSNDPWGPSGTQMNEIAQMTYNQNDFVEIMEMLDKRLNDKGKNWRHVFKSLTLLDYCLHAGSENVVIYFRDNIYVIKTLKEFQFVDEYGKDQGANVRQKAKDITNLLSDESRLREERRSRAHMRDRMTTDGGPAGDDGDFGLGENENHSRRTRSPDSLPRRKPQGDDDLRRAIEESKRTAAAEGNNDHLTAEERDIQEALRLSKEEEERRARLAQDSTEAALFDDNHQLQQNGFPLVDASAQNQFQGVQPQFTSLQPQFTSFNPYQQQAQQEAMQQQWMQQQADWMRQQQEQQALAQQQQLQQQQQEEWLRQQQQQQFLMQQQQQQQQQVQPQPTGFASNNPFALSTTPSAFSQNNNLSPSPSSFSPPPGNSFNNFNIPGTYDNRPAPTTTTPSRLSPAPTPISPARGTTPIRGPTRADQEHAHLANLIGNAEDGVDTFGNYGQLRYGGGSGAVNAQKTGTNPFSHQQMQQQPQQSSDQPFFSV